jgi:hypothetical protein
MKKFAMSLLTAGLLISSGLQAQENAGGANAGDATLGGLDRDKVVAGTVTAGILLAAIANSNGKVTPRPPITCPEGQELVAGACVPIIPVEPTCNGDDELVDGVCIGTSTTVTVTASGTTTSTIMVPVTFTYLPTIGG